MIRIPLIRSLAQTQVLAAEPERGGAFARSRGSIGDFQPDSESPWRIPMQRCLLALPVALLLGLPAPAPAQPAQPADAPVVATVETTLKTAARQIRQFAC